MCLDDAIFFGEPKSFNKDSSKALCFSLGQGYLDESSQYCELASHEQSLATMTGRTLSTRLASKNLPRRTVNHSFLHPFLAHALLGTTHAVPYISHDFISLVSVFLLCDYRIWMGNKLQLYPRVQLHRSFARSEWEVKWPREKKDYCCKRTWPA